MPRSIQEETLVALDQIRRLLCVIATQGQKQREQIATLAQAGLPPKDIADLLGTSSNTVRVELVGLRRARRVSKGRQPGAGSRSARGTSED